MRDNLSCSESAYTTMFCAEVFSSSVRTYTRSLKCFLSTCNTSTLLIQDKKIINNNFQNRRRQRNLLDRTKWYIEQRQYSLSQNFKLQDLSQEFSTFSINFKSRKPIWHVKQQITKL